MPEKILIDLSEVARLLGVSRPTVYSLLHREYDPLPYIKIGRLTKVKLTDLNQWLDRQGVEG
ncbi:MAG: helix-turn-helix domain-containing protein [Oscillospiraceae bacterium]|nr:helix-turn-helix domain-containing protein [Oscillospiraceae bacterium]